MGFVDKFFGPTIATAINGVKDDVVTAVREEIVKYGPQLIAAGERALDKYGPQILEMARKELHDQFEQWMPILMTGLSKSVVETSVRMADKGVDDLVKLTPTQLDDTFVAPIAKGVIDWLGQVFSAPPPPNP